MILGIANNIKQISKAIAQQLRDVENTKLKYVNKIELKLLGDYNFTDRTREIDTIVEHYVGGKDGGNTNDYVRNYFNLKDTNTAAHFVLGTKGEIMQLVPLSKQCYHAGNKIINDSSIGIEMNFLKSGGEIAWGEFSQETIDSCVELTACLMVKTGANDVLRHSDVIKNFTTYLCPYWFVKHPELWDKFLQDVEEKYLLLKRFKINVNYFV